MSAIPKLLKLATLFEQKLAQQEDPSMPARRALVYAIKSEGIAGLTLLTVWTTFLKNHSIISSFDAEYMKGIDFARKLQTVTVYTPQDEITTFRWGLAEEIVSFPKQLRVDFEQFVKNSGNMKLLEDFGPVMNSVRQYTQEYKAKLAATAEAWKKLAKTAPPTAPSNIVRETPF